MIAVYGSLIAILLCTFLPPLLDCFIGNKDEWSWKRALGGYALMTGLGGVVPVLVGGSLYINWLFVVLAVTFAVFVSPVTFLGTFFILILLNIILPILVLWDMARYNVKEPIKMLLDSTDYTVWLSFLVPMLLGLITFYVAQSLRQRLTRKEKHPTVVDSGVSNTAPATFAKRQERKV